MDQRYNFADPALRDLSISERTSYIRKVFGLVLVGLLVAAAGAQVGMSPSILPLVAGSPFISFLLLIGMVIWAQKASNGPKAIPIFYGFTFVAGAVIAPVIYVTTHQLGGSQILANAMLLTGLNVVGLAAFSWFSKKDFSFLGGFLFIGLLTLIGAQLLNLFFFKSSSMVMATSIVGALLFNGFLLYDLSRVMNSSRQIPPTVAALTLFLDIFNLFLFILRIMGGNRD
ncbi:MAG: Bax inhibitor-1/YccA family protein [Calditrichaeota bacterium]|nr:Bax inhibitor-1/YccA family protein [Candidatus Cloacimonadota bacterium]MCB1046127.1 Bax inhibitor-1/YccA family protein [Calditrichota bacterium]MCB9472880.1 Bax inhibitor-1/YccA family protein [Candidatus Delongbacteria bacterium]